MFSNGRSNMAAGLVLLAILADIARAVKIFDGKQKGLFKSAQISTECDAALDTELDCPQIVRGLEYPNYWLNLTIPTLESLCSSACLESIQKLSESTSASCQHDVVSIQAANMSFADFGQFVAQRTELMCLREIDSGGRFCHEVMPTWNITALEEAGEATWPKNSPKCFYNPDGECLTIEEMRWGNENEFWDWEFEPVSDRMFQGERLAGLDYVWNRSQVLQTSQRHSLGASAHLDWDEYPLEIQCQRCFWKTFAIGHQSQWAHMIWDEWAEQTWQNMIMNCDIPEGETKIVPVVNSTGVVPFPDGKDNWFDREPDWDLCPTTGVISEDNEDDLFVWAQRKSYPSSCIQKWNPMAPWESRQLRGKKLCLPLTCEVAVVNGNFMTAHRFVSEGLQGVTLREFLAWNKCLHRDSFLYPGETVCIAPPGGRYAPTLVEAASPTVWTATATPSSPLPSDTTPNCGKYHVVAEAETCAQLSMRYHITFKLLREMNPSIDRTCSSLAIGQSYCVVPVDGKN